MSHSFSFGGGGNDSSLNPLAFDSPVVRERHSRYSRLTGKIEHSFLGGFDFETSISNLIYYSYSPPRIIQHLPNRRRLTDQRRWRPVQ